MKLSRPEGDRIVLRGFIEAELYDHNGQLMWRDSGRNLVVDEGLNFVIDTALSGSAQDTTFFIGLKDTGTAAAGWTLSTGLTEINPYAGNRPAWTEDNTGSDQSVSNSASPASFSINATDTVFGAFIATVDTGTAGTLIAAGDFGSSVAVANGNTLNVTYTINAATS